MENKIIVSSEGNKHLAKAFYSELMAMGLKTRNSPRDLANLEADTCYFVVTMPNGKKTVSVDGVTKQTANFDLPKGWTDAIKAIADLKETVVEKVKVCKFAVGDIVVVDNVIKGFEYPGSLDAGVVFRVDAIEKSSINKSGFWLKSLAGSTVSVERGSHVDAGRCRKASETEIEQYIKREFTVGTPVFVFDRSRSGSANENGKVYKVLEVDGPRSIRLENPYSSASYEGLDSCRLATHTEAEKFMIDYNVVTVAKYCMKYNEDSNTISFGCQKFTRDEVEVIYRLFDLPVTATLTLGDTVITEEMMKSMLASFK
jgi:hypothetical protein